MFIVLSISACKNPANPGDSDTETGRDYSSRPLENAPYVLDDPFHSSYTMPGPNEQGGGEYLFTLPDTVLNTVHIAGDFNDWNSSSHQMKFDEDQKYWWIVLSGISAGTEYKFVLSDENLDQEPVWVGDPYGRAFRNDGGNSFIVSTDYSWTISDFSPIRPAKEDLVIYEMHLDDFTREDSNITTSGIINRVIEKIPYLVDLGVNAVEIMPIQHWPGGWYSWGYNNSGYFAIESSLGSTEANAFTEFKALVDELHQQDIAVILDVVYNHTANSENHLWAIDEESYFEGETPWGNRLDFTNEYTQKFFLDNMKFLMDEFKIDGFRFDAVDYIDVVDGLFPLIQQLVENGYDDYYYIAEQFDGWVSDRIGDFNASNGQSIISSWGANYKIAAWNALESNSSAGLGSALYYINAGNWAQRPADMINFVSSHDEGTLWSQHNGTVGDRKFSLDEVALGQTTLFTSLGVPMMWMGDEILRVHYGNKTPSDYPYDNIDKNANLVEWDTLYNNASTGDDSLEMYEFMKGLIELRLGNDNLTPATEAEMDHSWAYEPWQIGNDEDVIAYSYGGSSDPAILVVLNQDAATSVNVAFPSTGDWDLIVESSTLKVDLTTPISTVDVTGGTHSISIGADEALVYRKQ